MVVPRLLHRCAGRHGLPSQLAPRGNVAALLQGRGEQRPPTHMEIELIEMQVRLVSPESLIPTEDVDPERVIELQAQILRQGIWTVPITIEKDALFVMDGHHRLTVARRLRLAFIPVVPLDYTVVRLESWRPDLTITPACIFAMARSGRTFPCKTTRHIVDQGLPSCSLSLEALRHPAPARLAPADLERAG